MRFLSESCVPQVRALGAQPKNCLIIFVENKIGTPGTQILRNKFDFGKIGQKIPLPCLFLKKKTFVRVKCLLTLFDAIYSCLVK
jgi:hypothetical protein